MYSVHMLMFDCSRSMIFFILPKVRNLIINIISLWEPIDLFPHEVSTLILTVSRLIPYQPTPVALLV